MQSYQHAFLRMSGRAVYAAESGRMLVSRALLGNDFIAAQRQLDETMPAQRDVPDVRLLQG